jgi:phosphatidylglycerophosphate synthase
MSLYQTKETIVTRFVLLFPRWITPMQLSLLRLALALPIIYFLLHDQRLIALIIFLFSAFLDLIDGPLARVTNRVSDLGKLLDPLADKVMVLPVLCHLFPTA